MNHYRYKKDLCMCQVVLVGPHANSSEHLLGNYYGQAAGRLKTPLQVFQVWLRGACCQDCNSLGHPLRIVYNTEVHQQSYCTSLSQNDSELCDLARDGRVRATVVMNGL